MHLIVFLLVFNFVIGLRSHVFLTLPVGGNSLQVEGAGSRLAGCFPRPILTPSL